jgi:cyanophycinase
MRKLVTLVILGVLTLILAAPGAAAGPRGFLFIVGGGDRDEPLMRRFVELAKGHGDGRFVVFTMATSVPEETGPALVAEFQKLGVADVRRYHLTREEALKPETAAILDGASAVWFSGGDQARHTAVLLGTPLHERLLQLYEEGAVMGGTSAGAAVMSEVMITGDEKRKPEEGHEFETIEAGNVVTTPGLGFLKGCIIDQHFVTRKRHNRLISLVLEKPRLLGVGIDESTAIIVRPDLAFEVAGEKQAVVYDARRAKIASGTSGPLGGHGLALHVLVPGDVFDLKTGVIEGGTR